MNSFEGEAEKNFGVRSDLRGRAAGSAALALRLVVDLQVAFD